jgi:predicted DNA-binding transcriptional regulator YafY
MRGSDWQSFRRSLALVQRLRKGAATPGQLVEYVLEVEGSDAYPKTKSARDKAFKRDRENLRSRLGVDLTYSPRSGLYTMRDAGEILSLTLSENSLMALGLLEDTFEGQVAVHSSVKALLDEIMAGLSPAERRKMERAENPLELEMLQNIESVGIPRKVWEDVQRAVKKHRKLYFNYISPQYEDQLPVLQEVNPYKIVFQWGHWYLLAYRLSRGNKSGGLASRHVRYRISSILNDEELKVSSVIMPPPPTPPMYEVRYRLLPPLSRSSVSQHFVDQKETRLEDGTLEVSGLTESVWEAGKLFLAYGESCVVLGGDEMMEHMTKELRGLIRNYPQIGVE